MRISGWSSDVCSSDLRLRRSRARLSRRRLYPIYAGRRAALSGQVRRGFLQGCDALMVLPLGFTGARLDRADQFRTDAERFASAAADPRARCLAMDGIDFVRSEEHTSELQSLMRISYAVFCLKKQKNK